MVLRLRNGLDAGEHEAARTDVGFRCLERRALPCASDRPPSLGTQVVLPPCGHPYRHESGAFRHPLAKWLVLLTSCGDMLQSPRVSFQATCSMYSKFVSRLPLPLQFVAYISFTNFNLNRNISGWPLRDNAYRLPEPVSIMLSGPGIIISGTYYIRCHIHLYTAIINPKTLTRLATADTCPCLQRSLDAFHARHQHFSMVFYEAAGRIPASSACPCLGAHVHTCRDKSICEHVHMHAWVQPLMLHTMLMSAVEFVSCTSAYMCLHTCPLYEYTVPACHLHAALCSCIRARSCASYTHHKPPHPAHTLFVTWLLPFRFMAISRLLLRLLCMQQ
jgi:hypothetical protein